MCGGDHHLPHPESSLQDGYLKQGAVVIHPVTSNSLPPYGRHHARPLPVPHNLPEEFQFSSVAQLCPTPCDPMNCSKPGLPVHNQVLESTQTHVHRVSDAIQPSHPLSSLSPPAFSIFPSIRVFPNASVASGGQGIGASASASVLPMTIQD